MKKFGFIMMTAALAVLSFTSCEKKGEDPINIDPPVEVEVPKVDATVGAVTLVVKFDVAPCEGYDILFVGKYDDTNWAFGTAHAMQSIGDGWYKIVLLPGEVDAETGVCISGRPIQAQNGEGEWSYDWSHNGEDLVLVKGGSDANIADSGYGEINLNFTEGDANDGLVIYLESKKWNVKPCASAEAYNLTLKAPEFCGQEYDIEFVGSFEGWGATPVAMTKNGNVYTATIQAKSGDQIKFRGVVADDPATEDINESWSVQINGFDADNDKWNEMPNQVLGDETNVTFDWSDPEVYSWGICLEN